MGSHLKDEDMSARTSDVLPICGAWSQGHSASATNQRKTMRGKQPKFKHKTAFRGSSATITGSETTHSAFSDDENADSVGGDLVLAQQILDEGIEALPDDLIRRLRKT